MQKHNRRKVGTIPPHSVRVCPSCERILIKRPYSQRFCSTSCYARWRLAESRNRKRPPRFDLLIDRLPTISAHPDDELSWEARGAYWEALAPIVATSPRESSHSLVITGHGVKLRVDGGTLVVDEGLTHHPQVRRQHRLFRGARNLPNRIVLIACDGFLTLDVLHWLAKQNVPLIVLDWNGELRTAVGITDTPYDVTLRHALAEMKEPSRIGLARWLIESKVKACYANLDRLDPSPMRSLAMSNVIGALNALRSAGGQGIEGIRLVEARAAAAYFGYWQRIPVRWKVTKRYPVPADWLAVGPRQSFYAASNRMLTSPFSPC